jgi:thymidine kinase
MAKLYFRYGAMNCGKSTALIQVAHNYEERGMHVLLIKPKIDTKGADQIVSRIGTTRIVDILASADLDIARTVRQWSKDVENISCVLVDESQFLQPDQIDQLLELTVRDNIPVMAYGLRSDFQTKAFPGSLRLFELAHAIEELKTICRCGKKALYNGRKINGTFVFEGNQVAIDGENEVEYESLCAHCYMKFRGTGNPT